ncbi:HepT-like ribonuclease domain-containing protein [Microbacterium sp. Mu-80]|uniref:HepT-like ribonuclease domain-containing protein n=1 Tax=Microbacterium bandirmense TaxID=3122050 RepID=A0ABU8LA01_9MICO
MTDEADSRAAEREARIPRNLAVIEARLRDCADLAGRGEAAFFGTDFVNRYAAYAALIQIGNAAKDLPEQFRTAHPEVGWRALTRTRDKVGHLYGDSIDWDVIWATLLDDVPTDLQGITRARRAL